MTTPDPGTQPPAGQGDPAGAPPSNAPWYGTPDSETLGYMQSRGYDKMTADKAALEAMKAHREAEKLVGVPKEQLVRIPPKDDVKSWNEVYQRLGRPTEAKEYDFTAFKDAQGQPLVGPEQTEVLRDLAFSLNLSKEAAVVLVQKLSAIAQNEEQHVDAASAAEHAKQLDTLKQNWAFNTPANRVVADNAARALGLDPVSLDTNGAPVTIPYAQAQELFRQIGVKMGEDKFVRPGGDNPNPGPMSRDQAQYKLDQLKRDSIWYKKFESGDVVAQKEYNDLIRMVAGQ